MFKKLQHKWGVNGWGLLLIITTFALGGSLCGFLGRKILGFFNVEKGFLWVLIYIPLITIIWPFCVLFISLFTGKFLFFRQYILKIIAKFSNKKNDPKPTLIAIFASGAGSNAQKLIEHFAQGTHQKIALIVTNNSQAGVLQIAQKAAIPSVVINANNGATEYLSVLEQYQINYIVLAGYLKKIPAEVIQAYPQKIINIHPALLPAYGGAGMYGIHVHKAVIAAKETQSGITIHFVDELYDHGKIICQKKCHVNANDTAETLAAKVLALEWEWYGKVVKDVVG